MNGTEHRIEASPTKAFFIHMLVRDIELIPAIGDLLDNSVDGALRLRPHHDFSDLFVRISATPESFTIEDNCGGISIDMATTYAFRFGRPPGMEDTPHSIGQFGVGMKRALFKLGSHFRVESSTVNESLVVDVDVDEWQDKDEWEFTLTVPPPEPQGREPGTRITVSDLHPSVESNFENDATLRRLADTLGAQHQQAIGDGLLVTLNAKPIGSNALELLSSSNLKPAAETLTFFEYSDNPVTVQLYVGIVSASSPQDAGWYVYCNGRLVLGAEKTQVTGWGAAAETRFPRFHNRYGRFRGYAFFDCDDASRLPWTTTKTGIDRESGIYKRALQRMLELGRPVINFLQELSRETESPPKEGEELSRLVDTSDEMPLPRMIGDRPFTYARPKPKVRRPNRETQSIQYSRPVEEIEVAKRVLRAGSASEVGQRTFDYFYKRECQD